MSINRTIPFSRDPNPPARPFAAPAAGDTYEHAKECLATAIYYEAGSEDLDGQRAVAQVILNRTRHPGFPSSICGTVYEGSTRRTGCQFSFTCDGSLRRQPDRAGWIRAHAVAQAALAGGVFRPVGNATHYHADYVVPYWATSLAKNAVHGRHIFYRWPGWWGTSAAFRQRYAGVEPNPRLLRLAALRETRTQPDADFAEHFVVDTDPRVELISIIQMLAAQPAPRTGESSYQQAARAHFAPFANHLAVQLYRQLSVTQQLGAGAWVDLLMNHSALPALEPGAGASQTGAARAIGQERLAGFLLALRDFVSHSKFETFLRASEPQFAEMEKGTEQRARQFSANLLAEGPLPTQKVRLVVAPLLADASRTPIAGCQAAGKLPAERWLLLAPEVLPEASAGADRKLKSWLQSASGTSCSKKA